MKNILVTGGIALVVSLVVALVVASNTTPSVTVNEDSIVAKTVRAVKESLDLGSQVGPDLVGPANELTFNGALLKSYSGNIAASTTGFITFPPVNASSTVDFVCDMQVATSAASVATIAASTGGYATTTRLSDIAFAAGAGGTISYLGSSTTDVVAAGTSTAHILSLQGIISGAEETAGTYPVPGYSPVGHCTVRYWGI